MPKHRSISEFHPYNNEFLVTIPDNSKTESGVFIPDGAELEHEGELHKVVAIGPKCSFVRMGDEVILRVRELSILTFKEGQYGIVRENQIAGVIRSSDPDAGCCSPTGKMELLTETVTENAEE